jgi:hypothetical protein
VADTVSEQQAAAQPSKREEQALVLARRRAEEKVPRHRFGVAYLALAALLGASVGLFVVFVTNDSGPGGGKWSTFKPDRSGVQGFDEIAKYVSREYALPSGRELVGVLSTPPVVQGQETPVPLRAIAVRTGLAGETTEDASFYSAGSSWAYVLCGFAKTPSCAIGEGTPSVRRYDLLRREALELSLYTFKYNHDIDSVITYMPPGKNANASGQATTSLIFLRRSDVKPALDEPLRMTLPPPKTHLTPGKMSAADLARVRRYTDARVYGFQFQQLADGTAIVVLSPIKA